MGNQAFKDFIESKVFSEYLEEKFNHLDETDNGFIYLDAYWIAKRDNETFWSMLGYEEFESKNLEEVEKWLWENEVQKNIY